MNFSDFRQVTPYLWEIATPSHIPARIYATELMLREILEDLSVSQLIDVAQLPGVSRFAIAMPDIHQGYGFPIGGVAAMRTHDGVISPGGVGYDINCGVRLLLSECDAEELAPHIKELTFQMHRDIPSGVGQSGSFKLTNSELEEVLRGGVRWALKKSLATQEDVEVIEERGSFDHADPDLVSSRAKQRGCDQLGTLGAGNHFVEIQKVTNIFDEAVAAAFGIRLNQAAVMIHTGSRGLGHQVCTDYVRLMDSAMRKYGIRIPNRELACVPFSSEEGQRYFSAMAATANFAWVNRQIITHEARSAWEKILGVSRSNLHLLYDVAHNMAKEEKHEGKTYIVHRKGATRAFGPGHPAIPLRYRLVGQPVLIPGSMGTASYVLAGTLEAMNNTFGSCCHGAGRRMSRMKAKRTLHFEDVQKMLVERGIIFSGSKREMLEEAPSAYKAIEKIIEVVQGSGIARCIARLEPLGVVKG